MGQDSTVEQNRMETAFIFRKQQTVKNKHINVLTHTRHVCSQFVCSLGYSSQIQYLKALHGQG